MKRLFGFCAFLGILAWGSAANAAGAVWVCDPVNLGYCANVDSTGHVLTSGSSTPSGTQDVNVKNLNGGTISTGTGASGAQTQRVVTSTDSTIGVEGTDGSTQASPANPFPVTPGTGSTFTVVQPTGTNLHAVLDTTSTTAVTQATAANLNAAVVGTGTAGTPAGGVLTVQGGAGGTALPVSAASLPLPSGAATSANQPTNVAQGSTTSGETGLLNYCATLSAAPTYTTAQSNPCNVGVGGQLVTTLDGIGVTQLAGSSGFAMKDRNGAGRATAVTFFGYDGTNDNIIRTASGAAALNTGANVLAVEESGRTFSHISTSTTTTVKSGAGFLHAIIVNSLGTVASTTTVYDNTAGSGTVIAVINTLALSGTLTYDVAFSTGLTLVTTGTVAPDVTVSYR